MSELNAFKALSLCVTASVAMLVVAACVIRLRGDEGEIQSPASLAPKSDPQAAKLDQCRTVSYDLGPALLECQSIWAEKRRQFFGQNGSSPTPDIGAAKARSSSPVAPKDESRLPSGYPFLPAQSE